MGTVRQLVIQKPSIRPEQEPSRDYQVIGTSIDSDVLEFAKRIHANKPRVTYDLLSYKYRSKRSIKRFNKRRNKLAKLLIFRDEPTLDSAHFGSPTQSMTFSHELGRPISVIAADIATIPLQVRSRITFFQVFPQDGELLSIEEQIDRAVFKIQNQPVPPTNPSIQGSPSSSSPESKRVSAHQRQTPTQWFKDEMIG